MVSRDNKLIVIHDDTIDRTSDGTGNAGQMDYSELLKYDFGSWLGDEFKGEHIPLFEDVAKLLKDKSLLVNIEIKPSLKSDIIEDEVIRICKKYDIVEQSVASSFNHFAMLRMKHKFPEMETAVLFNCGLVNPGKYAKEHTMADGIHPHYLALIPETIKSAREHGLKIRTWTMDDENLLKRYYNTGAVDAVITNDPLKLRKVLNTL